uniref:ciliogenesis and planar polarity effector 2 isoform X3 n=1 Tax=Halichoerus grypus TaxID=9711 RepID=UPI0016597ECC|nr:ciliogenesis and planar polarity effector 2 isoform X3 [Halichoerus grypus]
MRLKHPRLGGRRAPKPDASRAEATRAGWAFKGTSSVRARSPTGPADAFCHLSTRSGRPAMARPPAPGSVIVPDWHESAEGKEYLACILRKNRRRVFGLLERPVLPPPVAIDTASYKIFVSGKSGVGKTALVAKLAGLEVPVVHHETTGIQTTVVFWPAKLQASDRVVMFRFEFWDCGESALRKFDHMLPACKEKTDAFLFLFSFTDRASFEDLPGQLARVAGEAPGVVRMVIGSNTCKQMCLSGTSQPSGRPGNCPSCG